MSTVKKANAFPSTSDPTGLTLLATDSSGNLRRLTSSGVVTMLAKSSSVMVKRDLQPQDLDADNLDDPMSVYVSVSDMGGSTSPWYDKEFSNFPKTDKPAGGFVLICLPEGNYMKQLYMSYGSNIVYVRSMQYSTKKEWSAWTAL